MKNILFSLFVFLTLNTFTLNAQNNEDPFRKKLIKTSIQEFNKIEFEHKGAVQLRKFKIDEFAVYWSIESQREIFLFVAKREALKEDVVKVHRVVNFGEPLLLSQLIEKYYKLVREEKKNSQ